MYSRCFPRLLSMGMPALAILLVAPGSAQEEHAAHLSRLPILVDGADTPEKIPDHLAYAHFIGSVVQPDAPSTADAVRLAATLERLQLSDADVANLHTALKGVHNQVDFIDREMNRLSAVTTPPSLSRMAHLRLQRTRVLDEAKTRLVTGLSNEGSARLDAYIKTHVKRRIVIYGDHSQ